MKKKTRIILVVTISVLLALTIFAVLFTVLRNRSPYITQDPVIIWTDDDFKYYNFPGDGTQDNPFIIENYNITTESGYGIFISETKKHIVIRNCYIDARYDGILIENVAEKTILIENNICVDSLNGISIVGSYYSTITNNTCENNSQNGINLYHTDFSTTADNLCNSNGNAGIRISRTYFSTTSNNNCSDNGLAGIYVENGYSLTIEDNQCSFNDYGLSLTQSEILQIMNNVITKNTIGIDFHDVDNSTLWMNYIRENEQYAIEVREDLLNPSAISSFNVIYHNSFVDNNPGGFSQAYCDFANNTWYNTVLLEGNFWMDRVSGSYVIDGVALLEDLYPLAVSPHETE